MRTTRRTQPESIFPRRIRATAGEAARTSQRMGFTLLEVLLALTLSVILLGAIFTAMDQSWRLTSSGRIEMERAQLARALVRRLTVDVRSIAFVPPPVVESEEESSSSPATTTGATSTEVEEVTTSSFGIRGDGLRVEMQISRPRRDLEFAANVDGNTIETRTSDLRVVSYQLGAAGGTAGTAATGLVRTEGDRLASLQVENQGGNELSLSASQVLAPEVIQLQFRYFDGLAWYPTWDSEQAGRLPRALEVTIVFTPATSTSGPALRVPVSSSVDTVRSVILLPIADPFPEEFLP